MLLSAFAVLVAVLSHGQGTFIVAVVNAVLAFWGNGVRSNFNNSGESPPTWSLALWLGTTLLSVILLIVHFAL